jgi:hypothetical protein
VRGTARRFLVYAGLLVVGMAIAGILYPRRLFVMGPWVMLPIAAAIGIVQNRYWRIGIALAMGIVAGVGWYGIASRRLYAAPRFVEPWPAVAQDAAAAIRDGALVIGNNPAFFFYLTYALQVPETGSGWRLAGVLPETVTHPQVWDAENWEAAGRPSRPYVFWVRGMPGPEEGTPIARAGQWLDARCPNRNVTYLARDPGYLQKQQFAPELNQLPWRVEVRRYACEDSPPSASP